MDSDKSRTREHAIFDFVYTILIIKAISVSHDISANSE